MTAGPDMAQGLFPVLLVDDEEGIRTVLSIVLAEAGYEVLAAGSGREALALFEARRPPVVITDIKMPTMDGIALLKAIKALDPDAEVIMTTGHGDMDLAVASLRHGASDFITKPIDGDALDVAISRAMEKIDLRRQLREHTDHLERLVEEKSARLLQAERMAAIGQTVAEMSHAIKNIAGGLEGAIYVLGRGIELDDKECLLRGWEMVRRDVGRVKHLALDLLDYARPASIRPEPCDPNAPARQAAGLLEARASEAGTVLVLELDQGMGERVLDPEAVHACLMNLLVNAMEAVEDSDREHRRVTLRTRSLGPRGVEYQVEDNGPGIGEEARKRLFSGFFTTKGSRGTGIGLMSVKKLMDEMGGVVLVESEPGRNTRFTLRIPGEAASPSRQARLVSP